jgi:hypothetical protein
MAPPIFGTFKPSTSGNFLLEKTMSEVLTNGQQAEQASAVVVPNPVTAIGDAVLLKQSFHFKTEKLRNEKGEIVGEGKKHPSVNLDLPVPTVAYLKQILAEPASFQKEVELLLSTLTDQVYRVARGQINDFRENNKDGTVTQAALNYDKLSWAAIANMPKSERGSSVPSDEEIKAFLDSYLTVMPQALNKKKEAIENHLLCFQGVFKKQRSQKDILEMFLNALAVYMTTVGEETAEEHIEVIEYFSNRLNKMLKSEEKITMDDL